MKYILTFILGAVLSVSMYHSFLRRTVGNPFQLAYQSYTLGCTENSDKHISQCRNEATYFWLNLEILFGEE